MTCPTCTVEFTKVDHQDDEEFIANLRSKECECMCGKVFCIERLGEHQARCDAYQEMAKA